jgi:hypothetical protein
MIGSLSSVYLKRSHPTWVKYAILALATTRWGIWSPKRLDCVRAGPGEAERGEDSGLSAFMEGAVSSSAPHCLPLVEQRDDIYPLIFIVKEYHLLRKPL